MSPTQILTDVSIRFRWAVFVLVLAASAWLGVLGARLPTNNSYETWLPENDYAAVLFRETDREFSSNALIFVVLPFPEKGVFHPDSLAEVERFTELLEGVPELFFVMSLTNMMDIRALEDGIWVGDLVPEIPEDPGAMEALRDYVLSREMYVNSLVSPDALYTALLMNIDGDHDEVEAASRVLNLLEREAGDTRYYFGGDPALAHYMNRYMDRDLSILVPFMFLVMIFILGFGLRRFWGVVLSLLIVVLSILWTVGFQQLLGMPLNLLTPAVMVLLIALGSDYAVHAMNHALRDGDLRRSAAQIAVPILMSALTTMAGLLTFGTTQIRVLNDFGYELAIGLGAACLLTLTFLVAMMRIVRVRPDAGCRAPREGAGPGGPAGAAPDEGHLFGRLVEALTVRILRHPRAFLAAVGVLVVVAGLGALRIHTNVDFVTFLPEDSPPRAGHMILQDHFGGIYPVSLYFRGDIQEPSLLTVQLRMENLLRGNRLLSGFSSVASTLAEMNRLLTGTYAVPESRAGVASLWMLMEDEPYLKTLVNDARDKALVNALVGRSETARMKETARFVERTLPLGMDDEALTLDPARLPEAGRSALRAVQLQEGAGELAALAAGYARELGAPPAPFFEERIRSAWPQVQSLAWDGTVEASLREYLEEESAPAVAGGMTEAVVERFRLHFPGDDPGAWTPEVRDWLAGQAGWDAKDAEQVVEGALWRCREALRAGRAERLLAAVSPGLPVGLQEHADFQRPARGVLWGLPSERPVVLASAARGIPGVDEAAMERVPVRIDQAGAPVIFLKFDELLYRSQFQSLLLATLVVLVLVSLIQKSLRRGIISIVAVLVPLEIVIGLMGWLNIPLDFGTALSGALVIGLGIDGCIHVMHYEAVVRAQRLPEERSLVLALRHVGRAVLTANATTAGGFAVLLFSITGAVRNFALVNVVAIVLVTASILTLLPVLIQLFHVFASQATTSPGPAPPPAEAAPGPGP